MKTPVAMARIMSRIAYGGAGSLLVATRPGYSLSTSVLPAGRHLFPALLLATLLAGCLAQPAPAPAGPEADAGEAFPDAFSLQQGHDHADPAGHGFAWNLEAAFVLPRAELLEAEEARLSDIQFHGGLAAVAVNGGSGGFVLLDASEPPALRVLGRYRSGSEDNWYVKFTPDGRHVLLTANGGLNPANAAKGALEGLLSGTAAGPARGLHVVDVTDPAAPRLAGHHAAPVRLVNAYPFLHEGATYVAASVVEDRAPAEAPRAGVGPANHVVLLRLRDGPAAGTVVVEEAARWTPPDAPPGEGVFPHDLHVETHPLTDRTLLYAAYWGAGAYVVDVTDPAAPTLVSALPGRAGDHVHTVKPHPGLVGGRHLTLVSPESFGGEPSGAYLLYDTTDPAAPALLDEWELPGGLANEAPLLWSPHEFSLAEGKAYVSQFHGGAGILSLQGGRLEPVAWWASAFPGLGGPARWSLDVETLVAHEGYAYAVDMAGGVLVLRETAGSG